MKELPAGGRSLTDIFNEIEKHYPGISAYILDEQGSLRRHVHIFIDGKMINDRKSLSDPFADNSVIYIMQALSGG